MCFFLSVVWESVICALSPCRVEGETVRGAKGRRSPGKMPLVGKQQWVGLDRTLRDKVD